MSPDNHKQCCVNCLSIESLNVWLYSQCQGSMAKVHQRFTKFIILKNWEQPCTCAFIIKLQSEFLMHQSLNYLPLTYHDIVNKTNIMPHLRVRMFMYTMYTKVY